MTCNGQVLTRRGLHPSHAGTPRITPSSRFQDINAQISSTRDACAQLGLHPSHTGTPRITPSSRFQDINAQISSTRHACAQLASGKILPSPLVLSAPGFMAFELSHREITSPWLVWKIPTHVDDCTAPPCHLITMCEITSEVKDLTGSKSYPLWLLLHTSWEIMLNAPPRINAQEDMASSQYLKSVLKEDELKLNSATVVAKLQDTVRRSTRVLCWRQESPEDEHAKLVHSIQALQIQVHGLSTHMLTTMEILAEQWQGQQ